MINEKEIIRNGNKHEKNIITFNPSISDSIFGISIKYFPEVYNPLAQINTIRSCFKLLEFIIGGFIFINISKLHIV